MRPSIIQKLVAIAWLLVVIVLAAEVVGAEPAVVAPPGQGQGALAVAWVSGELKARVCPSQSCDAAQGQRISLPSTAQALVKNVSLEVVDLGLKHHVVHLKIADPDEGRSYEALLAAPLGAGGAPLIIFQGYTGLVNGEYGAREGPMLYVSEATKDGAQRVVVGKQYESISICGRPSVLAPQLLNPRDLKLYPAKVQRLPPSERDQAPRLTASRLPEGAVLGPPVLKAVGASSAVGAPQNLTDGDRATSWAEHRGKEGRGEFVTFNVPPQLPIAGVDFAVRPDGEQSAPNAVSPREFWLATRKQLVLVTLPEDAWQAPGASFRVMLPEPLKTDCLALVIESAFGNARDAQVTLSEITAVSEFDASDLQGLVGALAGGGERAEAAQAVLMSAGPKGFRAVAKAYRSLDEGGRRVALHVMDQADCRLATPTYVRALLSRYKAHAIHAKERLRRCGDKSADHLVKTLHRATPRAWPILANELALVAPDRAVSEIAPLLDGANKARRSLLRVALARAASVPTAKAAVQQVLQDPKLSAAARLDVLRSLGDNAAHYGAAAQQAFGNLARQADFRTRYLLLKPAAALSSKLPRAQEFLNGILTQDPNQHLRWGAALAASGVPQLTNALMTASRDDSMRVRMAAVKALGERREQRAESVFVERLAKDKWPVVRGASAEALAGLAPSSGADEALLRALEDSSEFVRAPVADALGQRRVARAAPELRELLEEDREVPVVRRAAARALGRLCDHQALDTLTSLALKRADPLLDEKQKGLALAALEALSALGPKDLRQRLAPLFAAGAAPGAAAAATRAIETPASCAPVS